MSQVSLRLPDSLHREAKLLAKRERTSANQLITLAVAEKVSALKTLEWIEQRARRAPSAERFSEFLARAPDVEPVDGDA